MKIKYLIYLDILGFNELATKISVEKGLDSKKIRLDFINSIDSRIKTLESKKKITGKKYGNSDDWILVSDDLISTFQSINEIYNHDTNYEGYRQVPLEIAIGTGEYDKWASFDGKELIIEQQTIEFLKTNIINEYHRYYKESNNNQSPMSNFVILTESAFDKLDSLDKKKCTQILYNQKTVQHKLYYMDCNTAIKEVKYTIFLK